ncbi:hypothetical protein ACHAXR_011040 [Thalassiosira sp. AJA248-18]
MFLRLFAALPQTALAFTAPSSIIGHDSSRRFGFLGVASSAASSPSLTPITQPTTFNSPTFRVYIEDTDAYGVMYNGNYIRSYERALSHVPRKEEEEEGGNNDRWILSFITDQKFRSSPALGEEYIVRGERMERNNSNDDDAVEEVWQLEMVTREVGEQQGVDGDESNNTQEEVVHNSAMATLIRSRTKMAAASLTMPSTMRSNDTTNNLGKLFEQTYTSYHDEFETHSYYCNEHTGDDTQGFHIPLRSAMNFFERSRTSYLGGPDVLRKMQLEDDILWVVTSVNDGELLLDSVAFEHQLDDDNENDAEEVSINDASDLNPTPGGEVTVQTNFVVKRRGMIIDCQHRLYTAVNSNDGMMNRRLLAQATVTVMALKGSSRRPTSKLPQWVLDRIM